MSRRSVALLSKLLLVVLLLSTALPLAPATAYAKRAEPPVSHVSSPRKDRPVELAERRTPNSRTFRNPDGTLTTQVFGKGIHYRDAAGNLQLIQNTLVSDTGGRSYHNAANRYQVTFQEALGAGLLTFAYHGRTMSMDLEGAHNQHANLHGGNQLTYTEALEGIDLIYTTLNDAVKEEIILKTPEAAGELTFTIKHADVRVTGEGHGALRFLDSVSGENLWSIPQSYMRDAAGALMPVAVETRVTGNNLRLTFKPDLAWLQDPNRLYPVVIDPTIALQPDTGGGMDTTLANAEGLQDLNLGFDSALSAGSSYASLLKFDLSSIPRTASIESASLRLQGLSFAPTLNTTGSGAPTAAPTVAESAYTSALESGTYTVVYTYVTPNGETLPSPAASIDLEGGKGIDVSAGALPGGVTGVKFYLGKDGPARLALNAIRPDVTLVDLPDANAALPPMVPAAAPSVTIPTTSGSIAAGTYSVLYTYVTAQGETGTSPAASITVPASYKVLSINVGAFPTGVTQAKVYVGQPNAERLATTVNTSGSAVTVTTVPSTTAALPPSLSSQYVNTPTALPTVSAVAAPTGTPGFPAGTYQVRYTFVNSIGETPASPAQPVTLADGQALQITVGRLPGGISAANVYIGLTADRTMKLGTIAASQSTGPVTYGLPPALMSTPAPQPALAPLPTPDQPPVVVNTAGTSPFVAGTYDISYTFFSPAGETASSPVRSITLAAGDTLKVTAGQLLPPGALGMRVYMGLQDAAHPQTPRYLVAAAAGAPAEAVTGAPQPLSVEVKAPQGYWPVAAPTSSITYVANDPNASATAPSSAPTLKAMTLTQPATLEPATYYVKYSWIYPGVETAASTYAGSVTITDGQAIEVTGSTLPASALGMRVYMGRASTNLWLAGTSMGNRTIISGPAAVRSAPTVNTTRLPAPDVNAVSLSALPAGTYYVAYTFTTDKTESAPSATATARVYAGESLRVSLPAIPSGYTGANIYMDADTQGTAGFVPSFRLAAGTTSRTLDLTAPASIYAPALQAQAAATGAPAAPALQAVNPSHLAGGSYSVRYTFTDGNTETAPSEAVRVTVGVGQVFNVTVPPLPTGMTAANVYVGAAGQEYRVAAGVEPGTPVRIDTEPASSSGIPVPSEASILLTAPGVTAGAGGTLTGSLYFAYSFYGKDRQSARSPETARTFTSPNGTATVMVPTAPSWATGVRIYAGAAGGEGKLVADVPVTPGAGASVPVSRVVPNGLAIYPVTSPWTELDATWVRASANLPWISRGGDYNPEQAVVALGGGPTLTADLTALVQAWAGGALPNHGILLRGIGSTMQFGSSDSADEALRPALTITYREKNVAPRVTLTGATRVPDGLQLTAGVTTPNPGTVISRVEFYVNNALIGSVTSAPYTFTWNTANLPAGTYEVVAKAYDQWGQEGSSAWNMLLSDTFEDTANLAPGSIMPDTQRGVVTLPVDRRPVSVTNVAASSQKTAESYLAENMLDGKTDTFWRSPGQPIASATETARFDLTTAVTSVSLTVKPNNAKDGLTVKVQAIDSAGSVLAESASTVLSADSQTVSVSASKSFNAVRLVFSNLRRDLASGLYHAEIKEVSGSTIKLAGTKSYQASYVAANAVDGLDKTHWVSAGKSSPSAQEYLELTLANAANALYIKPRTPGVSATVAVYKGVYQGWEPLFSIASLEEGLYPLPELPEGVSADRLRIYFTNLEGMSGPGAPADFYAGVDELVPYQLSLQGSEATLLSQMITLPAANNKFLLQADDSQPPGSAIAYSLVTGMSEYPITPGRPLTLPESVTAVRLQAKLTSGSPLAVPTLSSWQLYSHQANTVQVDTGKDTIPPVVSLILPTDKLLSGTVTLKTTAFDNNKVDHVDLFIDNETSPLLSSWTAPFDFVLDTTTLSPGKHMFWAKAQDAEGNASVSLPATSTSTVFTDTLSDLSLTDGQRSTNVAVISGAAQAGTLQVQTTLTGTTSASKSISAGPGTLRADMSILSDANGCVAGSLTLRYTDKAARGDCRPLQIITSTTAVTATSYTVSAAQDATGGAFTANISYPGALSATAPYQNGTLISAPTVTAGPIAGITLTANVSKPAGTDIKFYASANDGQTWEAVTPGAYTALHHSGAKLRLRADLSVAAGAGYAYANLTPQLLDWSADVAQYMAPQVVTVSQIGPPEHLTVTRNGNQAALQWTASTTPGVTYEVYRATESGADGPQDLIASGLTGTSVTDGPIDNLLLNPSFENGYASWSTITHWHTTCDDLGVCDDYSYDYSDVTSSTAWAGNKSFYMNHSGTLGAVQTVTFSAAAGTTFSLKARMKGNGVSESGTTGFSLKLTYTDGTTATGYGATPAGVFDWTPVQVSITATKAVKSVTATLGIYGSGPIWYDGAQLDTVGAGTWYNATALDAAKTYYYRVVAVTPSGERSAPSEEVSTAAPVQTATGLGVKGFWPYAGVELPGGSGYVNMANGNLAYAATDMVYPGRLLAMAFRRTYNSQGSATAGALGYGWDHNFNWTLTPAADNAMQLKEGDGATFLFKPGANAGTFVSPPGSRMELAGSNGSYTLVRADNNLLYEFSGQKLRSIREPNGNTMTLVYTGDRLDGVSDSGGKLMQFTYTGDRITQIVHPGYTDGAVRLEYDGQGNLTRVFDLEGHSTNYEYNDQHNLIKVTDANGNATQVSYAGTAMVNAVTYPDGAKQTFIFGAAGDTTGWTKSTATDGRGFTVTYQVDASGLLKKQTFPYGTETPTGTQTASVLFEHDNNWNVTKYTDALGHSYQIIYDQFGNPLSITDPDNNTATNLYTRKPYPGVPNQSLTLVVQATDALGNTTSYITDDRGNLLRVEDALLQRTEYTYDSQTGLRTSAVDANGHTTRYTYNSSGWLQTVTDALGSKTSYTYDLGGNPATVTDALGHVTQSTYDRLGRQVQTTSPDGTTQRARFDAAGNLVEAIGPTGAPTRYVYDSRHRLTKLQQYPNVGDTATEYLTSYAYDELGQPVAVTDPRGKRSTVTYDGAGRTLTETNALGQKTTYTYDAAGNMIKRTDPLGYVATAEYDNLGRQTKTTIPQDSTNKLTTTITYDALGRQTTTKDGLGNTTTYYYDAIGRLTMVVDPMGFGTTYAYDSVGNRLAVTDAQRRTTRYVYDELNRVIQELRPDGSSVTSKYDLDGRLVASTNGRNQTIGYRYDDMNRLVETSYPAGRTVRYAYDNAGQRTSMTDWNGTTRYQYNQLGWLMKVEDPWGHAVSYAYDAAGERTSLNLQYTGVNYTWTYGYDDAGRLSTLQSPGVATTNSFTYDADGRQTKLTYANGDIVNHTYDQAGELKTITSSSKLNTSVLSLTYAYDTAGQRTSIGRSGTVMIGGSTYYKYDADSRVTSAGPSTAATNREYYYDLVGNRHTMVVNSGDPKGVYTYVYDAANRLIEEFGPLPTNQGGGRYHESYTYDGDGSTTRAERDGKEVTLYAYDESSRLLQVTNPLGQITRYTYNGDGQRVRMEAPSETTIFIYDGNDVLAEADATGAIQVMYTRTGSGRLISQWQKGETYWYHLDGLGSTIALVDESGKIRNQYGYDEYGSLDPTSAQEVFNRYTFTGQAWDSSAGLYHYKARYYNPTVGRFLTPDTFKGSPWQPATQNLYTYVGNNPVNLVDPTGHSWDVPWTSLSDFKSDWAGRAILWHWMYGKGEDMSIVNDKKWTKYMEADKILTDKVKDLARGYAAQVGNGESKTFDVTTAMEIENGEQIIGYQYLHGTNADAGGFKISGTITKDQDGKATISFTYQWNDRIDPNFIYDSDSKKAKFANAIGNPDDYNISIQWSDTSTLNSDGTFTSGWLSSGEPQPAPPPSSGTSNGAGPTMR